MKIKPATKRGQVIVELNRKDESILGTSQNTYNKPTPFSLKDILVPIDFSDCSKKALRYAVPLAKQFGATITLLHVVHVNYSAGPEFGAIDFPLIEAEQMPDIANNASAIAFGDFRRGYLIVDRLGVRVLRDPYSAKPYVLFYTVKRVGGGVQNFEAIKLLKFAAA